MNALALYEQACQALAEARAIDEVKDVLDKASAVRLYARQAGNRTLEIDAAVIRLRARRRMGDLLGDMREAGLIVTGPKPAVSSTDEPIQRVSLEDLGIDKRLSMEAQQASSRSISQRAFDAMLERMREEGEKGRGPIVDPVRATLKAQRDQKRRDDHGARTEAGGTVDDLHTLVASGFRAKAILMDPPWHFYARSDKGEGRSASGHYTTAREGLEAIQALPVRELADVDCVLFMWMVDWCPGDALALIENWGFQHKTTAFTWAKQLASGEGWHMGQGYWTRANPEDCWLATRGNPYRLDAGVRQLVVAPIMEHSRKPDEIHDRIERLVPGPYLELYARRERPGWQTWGNELAFKLPDGEAFDPDTGELLGDQPVDANKVIDIPAFLPSTQPEPATP